MGHHACLGGERERSRGRRRGKAWPREPFLEVHPSVAVFGDVSWGGRSEEPGG